MKLIDLTPEEKTGLMIIGTWFLVAVSIFTAAFVVDYIVKALDDGPAARPSEWDRK